MPEPDSVNAESLGPFRLNFALRSLPDRRSSRASVICSRPPAPLSSQIWASSTVTVLKAASKPAASRERFKVLASEVPASPNPIGMSAEIPLSRSVSRRNCRANRLDQGSMVADALSKPKTNPSGSRICKPDIPIFGLKFVTSPERERSWKSSPVSSDTQRTTAS